MAASLADESPGVDDEAALRPADAYAARVPGAPAADGTDAASGIAAPGQPAQGPGPSASRPDPAAHPLGERWAELVRRMAAEGLINALVRELAFQAECLAIDETAEPPLWRLRVERESLRGQAHRDRLQAALSQALGRPVRLEVEAGPAQDSPARRDAAERERRQAAAERLIREDDVVVGLLQQFKTARIVPGSIRPV